MIIKMKSQVNGLLREKKSTLTPDITINTIHILDFISEIRAIQCLNNSRKAAFNDDAAV
jgi:hypothetical protein